MTMWGFWPKYPGIVLPRVPRQRSGGQTRPFIGLSPQHASTRGGGCLCTPAPLRSHGFHPGHRHAHDQHLDALASDCCLPPGPAGAASTLIHTYMQWRGIALLLATNNAKGKAAHPL